MTADSKPPLPLVLLAAAGFLSAVGARVADPLLPMIARDFATSVPRMAIIVAAFTLPYGINQLLLGPIGDRYGKLRVMLGALVGYTIFTTACATATSLSSLAILRACAGASSAGLIPVCLAYIGDAVPYEIRQITLSRFAVGIVLAQIMAGPVGGVLGELAGWRAVFLLLGAAGVLVAATLAVQMRHLPDRRGRRAPALETYRALIGRSDARRLLSVTAIEGALTGGVISFMASYLHAKFGLSYALAGVVVACFGIGTFIYTRVARFIVARFDEATLALAGGVLIAVSLWLAVTTGRWPLFGPAQALIGFGYFMMHTVLQSRATELVPDARSTAVAIFVFVLFTGQAVGALAFGGLIAVVGYRMTFTLAAGCLLLLGGLLWAVMRRDPAATQAA